MAVRLTPGRSPSPPAHPRGSRWTAGSGLLDCEAPCPGLWLGRWAGNSATIADSQSCSRRATSAPSPDNVRNLSASAVRNFPTLRTTLDWRDTVPGDSDAVSAHSFHASASSATSLVATYRRGSIRDCFSGPPGGNVAIRGWRSESFTAVVPQFARERNWRSHVRCRSTTRRHVE